MQNGVDDGHGRDAHLGLDINRDAAAIVRYLNDVAFLDGYFDMVAVSGKSFVDGVVYNLIHQVVQAGRPR